MRPEQGTDSRRQPAGEGYASDRIETINGPQQGQTGQEAKEVSGKAEDDPRPEPDNEPEQEPKDSEDHKVRGGDQPKIMSIDSEVVGGHRRIHAILDERETQLEQTGDQTEPDRHQTHVEWAGGSFGPLRRRSDLHLRAAG